MSRLSTNIFLIFIILRVEKSSCDKSTDIHIYPYNIKHRIEDVLWTVLSIDPWERCSNTEPYTHIRRHLHSVSLVFFLFLRAPEREREREKFAFIPNRSRIPFQFQRFKFAESRRNDRQPCILRFKLAKFELSPIANINLPPPLSKKWCFSRTLFRRNR